MWIKLVVIFFVILAQVSFIPRAGAGDEEFHLKILEALKRMNVRLVRIEVSKLRSLKAVQESLLNQIMALRTSLEQIQATGEMNKTEMLASTEGVKTKILDVESHLKNEVMQAFDGQNRAFSQLKDSLATDMGSFSKANQQQFENISEANNKQLQQIVSALEEQNKKLVQTQALFKTDLIPALDTQNEETRQALLRDLSQAREVQKNFLESNHKQILASLGTAEAKNKALIEILKKIILVDESTNKAIVDLRQTLVPEIKNIADAETDLKLRLARDLTEVKENQNTAKSHLKTLVSLSHKINQQSAQMEKNIQQSLIRSSNQINKESAKMGANISKSIDIAANNAKAQGDLSNEKLSRLVDILKSFAIEQSKTDQVLQALSVDQAKLATQENEITKALKDLRRKANVNISRSDDILKKLKKQK